MKTDKYFGLVIGRFQPPCLHHLEFIKEVIDSGIKELLIGIGDSGIITEKDFLRAEQIKILMDQNIDSLNFPYQSKIIPDIHNPPKYANHVTTFFPQINESNTCLFTDNNYTSDCFINYGHNFTHIVQTIIPIRATEIRQMIAGNNPSWMIFTPQNVVEFINKNKPF